MYGPLTIPLTQSCYFGCVYIFQYVSFYPTPVFMLNFAYIIVSILYVYNWIYISRRYRNRHLLQFIAIYNSLPVLSHILTHYELYIIMFILM